MPSDIKSLQRSWEALGREDAMWAVLTDPAKRGGGWDPAQFLASGEREIATVFARLADLGLGRSFGRALDFGCGAGRLTQALAGRCGHVDGVDIATSMLEVAQHLNSCANVQFHHNAAADLSLFDDCTFDYIYCSIVLQHMQPSLARGYLVEFVRLLVPEGVLVFQVPDRYVAPDRSALDQLLALRRRMALRTRLRQRALKVERRVPPWAMEMHEIPDSDVRATFAQLPCRPLDVVYTNSATDDFNGRLCYFDKPAASGWVSMQWTIVRDDLK
jgi:SAM-dependent methyltransferase